MRILAKFRPCGQDIRPFFPARLKVNALNIGGSLDFLCDTGARLIDIGKDDADRLGVPYKNYQTGKTKGVGGKNRVWVIDEECDITFKSVDGRDFSVHVPLLRVIDQKDIPSLMGQHFWKQLGFRLIYDMPAHSVYMEL